MVNFSDWAPGLTTNSLDGTEVVPVVDGGVNGKTTTQAIANLAVPTQMLHYAYVESGCVWTGDSLGTNRNASMSSGVVWIAGKRLTVAAVTARTFTASKDTYVDLRDNGDSTASITYTEATNNAVSPALASSGTQLDTIRCAIIVTGASAIASATLTDGSVGAINQGSTFSVLPIASSVPYAVTDSLGNLIYNASPSPRVIGYRQIVANFTSTTTPAITDITGLSAVPFIIPTGPARLVRSGAFLGDPSGNGTVLSYIRSGSTTLDSVFPPAIPLNTRRLAAGSYSHKASFSQSSAGTYTCFADPTFPHFVLVEYV